MRKLVLLTLLATSSLFAQTPEYDKAEKEFSEYFDRVWNLKIDYYSSASALSVISHCDKSLHELVDLLHTGDKNQVKRDETHEKLNTAIHLYRLSL